MKLFPARACCGEAHVAGAQRSRSHLRRGCAAASPAGLAVDNTLLPAPVAEGGPCHQVLLERRALRERALDEFEWFLDGTELQGQLASGGGRLAAGGQYQFIYLSLKSRAREPLSYLAVVVAQHEGGLELICKSAFLVCAKHALHQREDSL